MVSILVAKNSLKNNYILFCYTFTSLIMLTALRYDNLIVFLIKFWNTIEFVIYIAQNWNRISKLHSLIHNQFASSRYKKTVQCSWYYFWYIEDYKKFRHTPNFVLLIYLVVHVQCVYLLTVTLLSFFAPDIKIAVVLCISITFDKCRVWLLIDAD